MEAFRLYMTKDGVWACNDLCYNYGTAHASLLKGYNHGPRHGQKYWDARTPHLMVYWNISVALSDRFTVQCSLLEFEESLPHHGCSCLPLSCKDVHMILETKYFI